MSDPAWLVYFGAVTGGIGTVSGVWAAVIANRAVRHAKEIKTLDLRVALRTELVEYRGIVEALPPLIEKASQSHQRVMIQKGLSGSGNMRVWLDEQTADLGAAVTLQRALPDPAAAFHELDLHAIEERLIALRAQRLAADELQRKYQEVLAADDRARE